MVMQKLSPFPVCLDGASVELIVDQPLRTSDTIGYPNPERFNSFSLTKGRSLSLTVNPCGNSQKQGQCSGGSTDSV